MRFPILLVFGALTASAASEWTRFRGPNGAGVVDGQALPREFGPEKNVVWKTAVPMGKSSPVVTADRIFLTGHTDGKLETLALDRKTGKILWRRESPGHRDEKRHKLNDAAAPSPASDGINVYVFFAGFGLVSYTRDGDERWRVPLGPFTNFHGMGASPVVADGKVFMICDQDQQAFLVAVDQKTGKTAWRVERSEMVHSFSTPVVYRNEAARRTELIVPGSFLMTAYDAANGKVVWTLRGLTYQVKSGPVIEGGVLYFNGWAPGGEPSERIELPVFAKMVELHDKDGDGKIARAEIPKEWQPANWEMQDLNKDNAYDERDWNYSRGRRTSTNGAIAVRMGGTGDV
ncbi:MAG: PQQ-like beta-propeller repeat protein, partial [Bryobacterales bacterium]|nr:PQQ-like beta-propeller repeat protein [Bryobacterales bacterium]